jgi:hypothetical protein
MSEFPQKNKKKKKELLWGCHNLLSADHKTDIFKTAKVINVSLMDRGKIPQDHTFVNRTVKNIKSCGHISYRVFTLNQGY